MPDEPEALGLLALMLLHDARREARDRRRRRDRPARRSGPEPLEPGAHRRGHPTCSSERCCAAVPAPYQLQAAIAALHLEDAGTDWQQIAALYDELARLEPTPIVELNRAVAVAMAHGPELGLELMERIDLPGYHLLPAARADLLRRLERHSEAAAAYREALALEMNAGDRAFLERRLAEVVRS